MNITTFRGPNRPSSYLIRSKRPMNQGELMLKLILAIGLASALAQAQPIITAIENAAGLQNCLPPSTPAGSGGCNVPYAPNTWYTIYGTNLATITGAWKASDFVNGLMPTVLNGVSVGVSNLGYEPGVEQYQAELAYVAYTSPTQVNFLTPPEAFTTGATVEINPPSINSFFGGCYDYVAYGWYCPAVMTLESVPSVAPNFFLYSGTSYVVAEHADGRLVGPTTLDPGMTTPAAPGETIVLYADGLGAVSGTIVPGSIVQSGTLLVTPAVQIGNDTISYNADVKFVGLISPGLYQINIVVPDSVPPGDNQIAIIVPVGVATSFVSDQPVFISVAAQ